MNLSRLPIQDKSDPASATMGVMENFEFIPKRIYWISDFVKGTIRGNHAHKTLNQIMFMAQGKITLEFYFGLTKEVVILEKNNFALFVPNGTWRVMKDADEDSVLVVLADQLYSEDDYIRDWHEYITWFDNRI